MCFVTPNKFNHSSGVLRTTGKNEFLYWNESCIWVTFLQILFVVTNRYTFDQCNISAL